MRVALCSLAALSACSPKSETAGGPKMGGGAKPEEAVRVRVVALERRPIASTIDTVGTLESLHSVELFPQASGVITELELPLHEEGAHVAEGELLAKIDDEAARLALDNARVALREAEQEFLQLFITLREARATLRRAQDAFDESEREFDNARRQAEQGLLSKDEQERKRFAWDQAASDLQVAQIGAQRISTQVRALALKIERARHEVSIQEDRVRDHRIVAPFAGVLTSRHIQPGQLVTPTTRAFQLLAPDDLVIYLDRPQRERALIEIGQQVELLPSRADLPLLVRASGKSPEALVCRREVIRVAPANVAGAGVFRVTVGRKPDAPAEPDTFPLYHGRSVRVRIILAEKDSPWLVPKKALLREGRRTQIFVIRDGVAKRVELEVGFSDDTHVEALNLDLDSSVPEAEAAAYLRPDDRIVLLGMDELEDGKKVDVVEAP
ncbi:MAG: HlyD family efflux transporter periplasmic adaptor subunit [Planctomycetes bacterium]|nr:HlyD family efflux transporter periplasmic adaptor subunit [Planctomycetota bacterium]